MEGKTIALLCLLASVAIAIDCPDSEPIQCPDEPKCIPVHFICDNQADCESGYDEGTGICTAMKRPPRSVTEDFLNQVGKDSGKPWYKVLLNMDARRMEDDIGGVHRVAMALSESPTIRQFSRTLGLNLDEVRKYLLHFFRAVDLDDYVKLEFDYGLDQEDIDGFKVLGKKLDESDFFDELLYVEV